jgi:hypothetical protein
MNILLAVDGSPYTQKMLAYLTSHPEILGAAHSYSAITVQPQLPARARAALGKDVVDEYYAEESTKVLDPVCSYLAEHGVLAPRLRQVGPPGHGLGQHPGAGRQPGAGAADPLIRCPVDMQRP